MTSASSLYGLIAEFADEHTLVDAVRRARADGYRNLDAYAPFSVEGLSDALGFRKDRVALLTLLGGIVGGTGVYFLQWYTAVIDYPINAGGRPLHSWPAYIIITFEVTILFAALTTVPGDRDLSPVKPVIFLLLIRFPASINPYGVNMSS